MNIASWSALSIVLLTWSMPATAQDGAFPANSAEPSGPQASAQAGPPSWNLHTGDADSNGFVDLVDFAAFSDCATANRRPPDSVPTQTEQACLDAFDTDDDGDVDIVDFAAFQTRMGHVPFPLKDIAGDAITLDSTVPYSGQNTCGDCHDVEQITNGFLFQQGRTDSDGNFIMRDNYHRDGRWWIRSAGMYGTWRGGGGGLNRQLAGKTNASESSIDMTTFNWAMLCGGCHVGGGGMEFDRDGYRLWDQVSGLFGYEAQGLDSSDVLLDGDYAYIDPSDGSDFGPARWDITGVAEPDCLYCHRSERVWENGYDRRRDWRASVLASGTQLVDDQGNPVPAFAAASTAGQGWYTTLETDHGAATVLQIDYSTGVDDGSLVADDAGGVYVWGRTLTNAPGDRTCWGCHLPGGFQNKRGTLWFDTRDVMYAGFNNLTDDDPTNDIAPKDSRTCIKCHPGGLHHNFARGNSPYARFRPELNWVGFRSCRECHLKDSPVRDPKAPVVPGVALVHLAGNGETSMMDVLSCQACHVPYPLERAAIVTDRSVTSQAITYFTDEFLSANPLNPHDTDKSRWYPALEFKTDSDGVQRLFPRKREIAIFWADWDQNGTPEDLTDDTIHPIILWRFDQITGGKPLPRIADDNGDGKLEINRPFEMLVYMKALKGNDSYGRSVAKNPVLVKGPRIWYEDPTSLDGVSWFEHADSGIAVESVETYGLDHNVLATSEAWGFRRPPEGGCVDCHLYPFNISPVFDRKILVDPFGFDGLPIYRTVREMTGVNPA